MTPTPPARPAGLEALIQEAADLIGAPAPQDRSSNDFDLWLAQLDPLGHTTLRQRIFTILMYPEEQKIAGEIKRAENVDARAKRVKEFFGNRNDDGRYSPKPGIILGVGLAIGLVVVGTLFLPKIANPTGGIAGAIKFGDKKTSVAANAETADAGAANPEATPQTIATGPVSLDPVNLGSPEGTTGENVAGNTASGSTPAKLPESNLSDTESNTNSSSNYPTSSSPTPSQIEAPATGTYANSDTAAYTDYSGDPTPPSSGVAANRPAGTTPSSAADKSPPAPPAEAPGARVASSLINNSKTPGASTSYQSARGATPAPSNTNTASLLSRTPPSSTASSPNNSGASLLNRSTNSSNTNSSNTNSTSNPESISGSASLLSRPMGASQAPSVPLSNAPRNVSSNIYARSSTSSSNTDSEKSTAQTATRGNSTAVLYSNTEQTIPATGNGKGTVLFTRAGAEAPPAETQAAGNAVQTTPNTVTASGQASGAGGFVMPDQLASQPSTLSSNTSSTPTAPQAPTSALPYKTGQQIKAKLLSKIVLTDGLSIPVLARGEDDSIWIGTASLDTLRRVQIRFARVVLNGVETPITASAFSPGGQPGLSTHMDQVAPDLAGDLLKAGVGGVANYVQGLANNRQVSTAGGATFVTGQVPGLLEQIGGSIASALSGGRKNSEIALVGVASVERETALGIIFSV